MIAQVTAAREFVEKINAAILNPLIALLFAVALVVFLWGLVQFIQNADSDAERQTGKQHMLWGIIGMFIMVSVFAIIEIALNTAGVAVPAF